MQKFFLDIFVAFVGFGSDGMRFGKDYRTELNQKLLKTSEIQILCLSFVQYFDIDLSDEVLNFCIGS